MAKKDSKNSKLSINDRMLMQACIAKGEPAASIAERIGFSVSTVYREIKRGSKIRNPGVRGGVSQSPRSPKNRQKKSQINITNLTFQKARAGPRK